MLKSRRDSTQMKGIFDDMSFPIRQNALRLVDSLIKPIHEDEIMPSAVYLSQSLMKCLNGVWCKGIPLVCGASSKRRHFPEFALPPCDWSGLGAVDRSSLMKIAGRY